MEHPGGLKKRRKGNPKRKDGKMDKTEYIRKEELISLVSEMSGETKNTCSTVLAAFCEVSKQAMKGGKGVQLPRFAKIYPVHKEARKGRNPRSGKEIEIPAQAVVRMLPFIGLKNALNGKE